MHQDFGLRALEGIQTISGEAKIPADAISYEITYLKFESGEFIGTGGISIAPLNSSDIDSLKVELLWRISEDDSAQVTLHSVGSAGRTSDKIFAHEYTSTHSGTMAQFEDYTIVGYACSFLRIENPPETLNSPITSPELSHAIRNHKYVVAVGIKFSEKKKVQ